MKCPNCNAEVQGTYCTYCGSELPKNPTQKAGCPKCSSSNISFTREKQDEMLGANSTQTIHRTVGVCMDCGHTWYTDAAPQQVQVQPATKRKTWLWVLGWIFIFPVPLTILLLRNKEMNSKLKYGIIIAVWIFYFIIAVIGNTNETTSTDNAVTTEENTENTITDTAEPVNESAIVDTFRINATTGLAGGL